jgi:cell division protein FtsB
MKRKINYRKIIFFILLVYLICFSVNQYIFEKKLSADINNEKNIVGKLKEEHDNLQDEVELAKTDKYKEILARQMLNLIKDGETPVINSSKK